MFWTQQLTYYSTFCYMYSNPSLTETENFVVSCIENIEQEFHDIENLEGSISGNRIRKLSRTIKDCINLIQLFPSSLNFLSINDAILIRPIMKLVSESLSKGNQEDITEIIDLFSNIIVIHLNSKRLFCFMLNLFKSKNDFKSFIFCSKMMQLVEKSNVSPNFALYWKSRQVINLESELYGRLSTEYSFAFVGLFLQKIEKYYEYYSSINDYINNEAASSKDLVYFLDIFIEIIKESEDLSNRDLLCLFLKNSELLAFNIDEQEKVCAPEERACIKYIQELVKNFSSIFYDNTIQHKISPSESGLYSVANTNEPELNYLILLSEVLDHNLALDFLESTKLLNLTEEALHKINVDLIRDKLSFYEKYNSMKFKISILTFSSNLAYIFSNYLVSVMGDDRARLSNVFMGAFKNLNSAPLPKSVYFFDDIEDDNNGSENIMNIMNGGRGIEKILFCLSMSLNLINLVIQDEILASSKLSENLKDHTAGLLMHNLECVFSAILISKYWAEKSNYEVDICQSNILLLTQEILRNIFSIDAAANIQFEIFLQFLNFTESTSKSSLELSETFIEPLSLLKTVISSPRSKLLINENMKKAIISNIKKLEESILIQRNAKDDQFLVDYVDVSLEEFNFIYKNASPVRPKSSSDDTKSVLARFDRGFKLDHKHKNLYSSSVQKKKTLTGETFSQ